MQFEIQIIHQDEIERIYIAFSEEKIFSTHETALDALLETLAGLQVTHLYLSSVITALNNLAEFGRQHERIVLLPDALSHAQIFTSHTSGLPTIVINKPDQTISIPGHGTVSLYDFVGLPNDRERHGQLSGTITPSLQVATTSSRYREDYFDAASIAMGMLASVTPGNCDPFDENSLKLAGVFAGLSKHAFQDSISGPYQGGASMMYEAYRDLIRAGVAVSNRGWMPQGTLRSNHFSRCLSDARADLVSLGETIGPLLAHVDPSLSHAALMDTLREIDEDPVQYSIRDRHRPDMSNHQSLKVAQIIGNLSRALKIDIPLRKAAS